MTPALPPRTHRPPRAHRLRRANPLAALGALAWLVVVGLPLYYLVAVSLRTREDYLTAGALSPPTSPTFENYATVVGGGFERYLLNTAVVTAASVALVLVLALPAAYAIVRGSGRLVRAGFSLLLLGLAIPAQAVIVPVYLIITRMHLYDSLTGIVLPTAAFLLPMAVLVLTSALRDIPEELYEAMALDGGGPARTLRTLVIPLSRHGLVTVAVYVAVNAWNGFLFPLVLTQSQDRRVLTMGLWSLQGQYTSNVPALMAAMTLSVLPVFLFYVLGRRRLVSGLTAGFGK
ncbi:carbohydrate ABC transporter permease [Actinomadura rugatobispora]|uniref:Carbohydrate ABC transporter permease n=1 Tax=Actinomadura rugatobispora TaxID=1994 RepID=A0ABW1A717_9ACTN|nr:carbohydrate ABC transporter permease [Actinomadura rugatobispora]